MRINKSSLISTLLLSTLNNAYAQEQKPLEQPAAATENKATNVDPKATKQEATQPPAEKQQQKKPKSTLSIDAYKRLIASKIAARASGKNPHGIGEVIAAFRVNEDGQIDQITIKKSSSPALSEHVKNILSGVKAPPPPEGPILLGQPFNFR